MQPTQHNVVAIHHRLCQTDWGVIMDAAPLQTMAGRFAFLANTLNDPKSGALLYDHIDTPSCVAVWLACPPQPVEIAEVAPVVISNWLQACADEARWYDERAARENRIQMRVD